MFSSDVLPPLDPARVALVVVDMQNDFVRAGAPLEVPSARSTLQLLAALIREARGWGSTIIFTRFITGPQPTLLWTWSAACNPYTRACWRGVRRRYADRPGELAVVDGVDELSVAPSDYIIDKSGYNAFFNTPLPELLGSCAIDTVVLTGTVTQICVEDTARGCLQHGFRRIVVADAVSPYDQHLHDASLRSMAAAVACVTTSDQWVTAMQRDMAARGSP